MSIITERLPQCDRCSKTFADFVGYETVGELRRQMKTDGWTYIHGNDYCPECSSEMKEVADEH